MIYRLMIMPTSFELFCYIYCMQTYKVKVIPHRWQWSKSDFQTQGQTLWNPKNWSRNAERNMSRMPKYAWKYCKNAEITACCKQRLNFWNTQRILFTYGQHLQVFFIWKMWTAFFEFFPYSCYANNGICNTVAFAEYWWFWKLSCKISTDYLRGKILCCPCHWKFQTDSLHWKEKSSSTCILFPFSTSKQWVLYNSYNKGSLI